MANPYHDETGRFCSKGEMKEAVDRVFTALGSAKSDAERQELGDQWFNLRNEYEAAAAVESRPKYGSAGWMLTPESHGGQALDGLSPRENELLDQHLDLDVAQIDTMLAGRMTIREDAELRELRQRLVEADYLHGTKVGAVEHNSDSAYAIFLKDHAEGRLAISRLSAKDQIKLLHDVAAKSTVSDEVSQAILGGSHGEEEEVIKAVLSFSHLTPGLKLNLAQRNNLVSHYATRNPDLFANEPALERQLISELAVKTEDRWDDELEASWSVVAAHAKSEDARNEVLGRFSHEDYSPAIIGQMAKNPNLDGSDRLVILNTVVENDAANWTVIASRMASAAEADTPERVELVNALERYSQRVANEETADYTPLDHHGIVATEEALTFYNRNAENLTDAEVRDRANCYTLLDAQPAAYEALRASLTAERLATGSAMDNSSLARRLEAATRLRAAHIATQEYEDGHYTL